MTRRITDVTSFTTLDVVDARARGTDWVDEATAIVDVNADDESPDGVRVDVELDPTALGHVEPHADTLSLSPAQARTLASELQVAAATVEDGADRDWDED